ncbi:MAG: 16S rRNA (cytosine(1402)-N(4))-methyltransferase RsmH [Kiritimatiellia bacterium]
MHVPVLLEETLAALAVRPGGTYIDGTLGYAGHAAAILRGAVPGGRLLGIDRDGEALARAQAHLQGQPGAALLAQGNHGALGQLARANGFGEVDGVLLDLGVSSAQLDEPARGFSFMRDGPLDMRMDTSRGETAADLVARLEVVELTTLFRTLGEEPRALAIARAIERERKRAAIVTTLQLAGIVAAASGWYGGRRHPATRVFQALRMAVNDELGALRVALTDGLSLLRPDGRMAVITFESLTDREVKTVFAAHAGRLVSLPQGGARWEGRSPAVAFVHRHPVGPGEVEIASNPRARSAKLRAVRRLTPSEEARLGA